MDKTIDTEQFISTVSYLPAIWDNSSPSYSNKMEKQKAWEQVCTKFCDNFSEKTKAEKNEIAFQFQRKWKHLRDGFSRELAKQKQEKSVSFCSSRKKYVYFDQLLFLQRVMQGKSIVLDLDDEEHQKIDEASSDDKTTLRPLIKKRKLSYPSEEFILHNPKDRIQFRCKTPVDESDADRLFMLSFVKELKQVPEEFKLEVKSDIINVFRKAKLYNSSKNTTANSV